MFDSSIFVKKMWALKRWCVTKVAHCMLHYSMAPKQSNRANPELKQDNCSKLDSGPILIKNNPIIGLTLSIVSSVADPGVVTSVSST